MSQTLCIKKVAITVDIQTGEIVFDGLENENPDCWTFGQEINKE